MKTQTRLWYLYDFANSFASIVLVFYFPLIFVERGGTELWVGFAASFATFILLFILPPIGRWADRTGKRIPLLALASFLMSATLVCMAVVFSRDNTNIGFLVWFTLALYVVFQISFQGSVSIYSSLLRYLSQEKDSVAVSGMGIAWGQFGNVVGVIIAGALVGGSVSIGEINGKSLGLMFGGIASLLIALPFLLKGKGGLAKQDATAFTYKEAIRKVFGNKRILKYLIGIMLIADAILTFQIYLTLYISKVFLFDNSAITLAAVIGLVMATVAGLGVARFVQRFDSPHRALIIAGLLYSACFLLLAIIPPIKWIALGVLVLGGLSYGLIFALGRVVYAEMVPHDEQSEYFSVYSIFERAASVVGPLLWAASFTAVASFGEAIQYRVSVGMLAIIALVGCWVLTQSNKTTNVQPAKPMNQSEA